MENNNQLQGKLSAIKNHKQPAPCIFRVLLQYMLLRDTHLVVIEPYIP